MVSGPGVMIIYTIIVYVLLLNLLIAELGDRISSIKDTAKPQLSMKKASIVLWMEKSTQWYRKVKDMYVGAANPKEDIFTTQLQIEADKMGLRHRAFKVRDRADRLVHDQPGFGSAVSLEARLTCGDAPVG
jgi:hypothetical protein